MKKIIIFSPYFYPGYKSGGPIQSVKNMVDLLNDEFDIYIITSDRDNGDEEVYNSVKINEWIKNDKYNIFYISSKSLSINKVIGFIKEINPDFIHMNSFYNPRFSMRVMLSLLLVGTKNVKYIVAPRGEFGEGALKIKSLKKRIYIHLMRIILRNKLLWHATNEVESLQILKMMGVKSNIYIANNLINVTSKTINYIHKKKGELKLIYLARIHPSKNLLLLLEALNQQTKKISLNIYGPVVSNTYWEKCKKVINVLPTNIKVIYYGEVPHYKVYEKILDNHFFILLTSGENFGHSIVESLYSGRPVIISDKTPWNDLKENNAGINLELSNFDNINSAISFFADLNQVEFDNYSMNAIIYIKTRYKIDIELDHYRTMFK
jgi:glycosyltransferase involved in cell wall biosynthesis